MKLNLSRFARLEDPITSSTFVEKVKKELGAKAMYRGVDRGEQTSVLREESAPYGGYFAGENDALSPDNTVFWDENSAISRT
jgi:hypothetical protein